MRARGPVLFAALTVCLLGGGTASAGRLQTALVDVDVYDGPQADLAFARTKAAGASVVRLSLDWPAIAPRQPSVATNPADPAYRWERFDRQVRLALRQGLQPLVTVSNAPPWAQEKPSGRAQPDPVERRFWGPFRPSPIGFARFARAAATRYSGSFGDLPRVRLWQAWNEPNVSGFLMPQFIGGRPASPVWYRDMLNRFAREVHAVRRDNVVVVGGLSPFTVRNKITVAMGPLRFMRELLCLSRGSKPRPTCRARAEFDVWAHHPYTSGGPTRHALHSDDVSLGDLPQMQSLLKAAVKQRKVVSSRSVRFWVTEFSWDAKPPDAHPRAVPIKLHARWVAEALYRMWGAGIELVTWFQLRDQPYPATPYQSGLYFRSGSTLSRDQPKPAFNAFRFPFVAYRGPDGRVLVWGRSPAGKRAQLVLEQTSGRGWRRVASLTTDRNGMFYRRLRLSPGPSRAPSSVRRTAAGRYAQTVLSDQPRSYWRLGERSGLSARDETGSRPGIYRGGIKLGQAGALKGDRDAAVNLDGRDDRVELGVIGSPKTIELWLKTETTSGAAGFSNRNPFSHYSFLGPEGGGGALVFDTAGLLGARWVTDGRWHHLVYTYENGSGRLYVDGQPDSQASWPRMEGAAPATLGYDAALKTFLRGSLDEVALYDRALSEREVKEHFRASGQQVVLGDQFGLVQRGQTYLRARLANGSASSLPFSLTRPPDRYVLPFGGGGS